MMLQISPDMFTISCSALTLPVTCDKVEVTRIHKAMHIYSRRLLKILCS